MTEPADVYAAAFAAQCAATARDGRRAIAVPGMVGLRPSAGDPVLRVLVTDDRAHGVLASLLPLARTGMVSLFERAERCIALLRADPAWRPEVTTALVRDDLHGLAELPLPSGLELRPVRRLPGDAPGAVALEDAAATALRADPELAMTLEELAGFLRSLPASTRLLAAVDAGGAVRATSGATVTGPYANVLFVNTDRGWRGRGIGAAMTTAALRAAHRAGARHAVLDATEAGLPTYRRLGFAVVSRTTRCFPAR